MPNNVPYLSVSISSHFPLILLYFQEKKKVVILQTYHFSGPFLSNRNWKVIVANRKLELFQEGKNIRQNKHIKENRLVARRRGRGQPYMKIPKTIIKTIRTDGDKIGKIMTCLYLNI